MLIIRCNICGNNFGADKYPSLGNCITCPHCGAEAYGTYNEYGFYMLEWYEGENVA